MKQNTENPVTGNGAGADLNNQAIFTKVISLELDSRWAFHPPITYQEVDVSDDSSLIYAIQKLLLIGLRTEDAIVYYITTTTREARSLVTEIKESNSAYTHWLRGHLFMRNAVKVGGKIYVEI